MSVHALLAEPAAEPEAAQRTGFRSASLTSARLGFLAVLALAFGLRAWMSLAFPDQNHPDETYQAFEQAHRYAFGYGIKPWEFEIGLRSTLLPFALSLILRVAASIGVPEAGIPLARIALALLSLLPVAAVYLAGLRRSLPHALVGGVAAATWCELVNFSYRPLTESVAASMLLTALALASFRTGELPRRVLVAIGACLAAALMLRVHFAPALAVVTLSLRPWRRFATIGWLGLGGVAPLAAFGLADEIAWGVPFGPPLTAIRVNVGQDVASEYGTAPAGAYVSLLIGMALPVLPLMIPALVLRGRSYGTWLLAAAAILASHSLIPHKEYRFVFVVVSTLVIAAAFGSADLLTEPARYRRSGPRGRVAMAGLLAATWALGSLLVATTSQLQEVARSIYAAEGAATRLLAARPDACGVLLDGPHWSEFAGYAGLRRRLPIYQVEARYPGLTPAPDAYNYVVQPSGEGPTRPGYEAVACFLHPDNPGVCVLRREGTCSPETDLSVLRRRLTRDGSPG